MPARRQTRKQTGRVGSLQVGTTISATAIPPFQPAPYNGLESNYSSTFSAQVTSVLASASPPHGVPLGCSIPTHFPPPLFLDFPPTLTIPYPMPPFLDSPSTLTILQPMLQRRSLHLHFPLAASPPVTPIPYQMVRPRSPCLLLCPSPCPCLRSLFPDPTFHLKAAVRWRSKPEQLSI